MTADMDFMRQALRLARRGVGMTSPNPMVGAVLVKGKKIIGQGWHHRAGEPHAEIEAIRDAQACRHDICNTTLYVTLEPCSTQGRTPPCTEAIRAAGIRRVVVAATDPNPAHAGRAYRLLRRARIIVQHGLLAKEATALNFAFNHWIVHRMPFVTVKSAMTMDGKIATGVGESKWITGGLARARGMALRAEADGVLVGINTILADNPKLTPRIPGVRNPRRIILDSHARTPLRANVVTDKFARLTTIVVGKSAPTSRVAALARRVNVFTAPLSGAELSLRWLLKKLGAEGVTSLLVEGGGEVNASFLLGGFAQRVEFFYAPKVLGGRDARKSVAGEGVQQVADMIKLRDVEWKHLGPDLWLRANIETGQGRG